MHKTPQVTSKVNEIEPNLYWHIYFEHYLQEMYDFNSLTDTANATISLYFKPPAKLQIWVGHATSTTGYVALVLG